MKEKLQNFIKILLTNADRTVTALLGLILLAMIGLYAREQTRTETPPPEPPAKPFDTKLPNEDYERLVSSYIQVNEDITQDPDSRRLIEHNMFDLKSVKEQEELAKQLDSQVDQAERLIQQGQTDEAAALLDTVLRSNPDHVRALDLLNQIRPSPSPSPSPTP